MIALEIVLVNSKAMFVFTVIMLYLHYEYEYYSNMVSRSPVSNYNLEEVSLWDQSSHFQSQTNQQPDGLTLYLRRVQRSFLVFSRITGSLSIL